LTARALVAEITLPPSGFQVFDHIQQMTVFPFVVFCVKNLKRLTKIINAVRQFINAVEFLVSSRTLEQYLVRHRYVIRGLCIGGMLSD
jgi:hypothetical protein